MPKAGKQPALAGKKRAAATTSVDAQPQAADPDGVNTPGAPVPHCHRRARCYRALSARRASAPPSGARMAPTACAPASLRA